MNRSYLTLMDYYNPNDSLSHHGVKGMKWGVRTQKPYVPVAQRRTEEGYSDQQDYDFTTSVSRIQQAPPQEVRKKSSHVARNILIAGGSVLAVAAAIGGGAFALSRYRKNNSPDSVLTEGGAALKNFVKTHQKGS